MSKVTGRPASCLLALLVYVLFNASPAVAQASFELKASNGKIVIILTNGEWHYKDSSSKVTDDVLRVKTNTGKKLTLFPSGSWESDDRITKSGNTILTAATNNYADMIPPNPLYRVEVEYPEDSKKKGIQGTVVLAAIIEKDGTVTVVSVVKSINPEIDASAKECLAKWLFEPAKKGRIAVMVSLNVEVNFKL